MRFRLQTFLQDAAAHKESLNLKGSSGSTPCPSCANVVGRVPFFRNHSSLVHVLDPDLSNRRARLPAQFWDVVDYLGSKQESQATRDFKRAEQTFGISFSPHGLLWDPHCRPHLQNMPKMIYWDWMHCWDSNGGVGRYHVNQLIRRISKKYDVTWEQWAKFARQVQGASGENHRGYPMDFSSAVLSTQMPRL